MSKMQWWVWAGHGPILEKFWAVASLVHFTMTSDVKSAVLGLGWAWPHFGPKVGKLIILAMHNPRIGLVGGLQPEIGRPNEIARPARAKRLGWLRL